MNLFEYKNKKWGNKEEPIFEKKIDLPKGSIGWLVIDSLGCGSAAGGIRLGENVNLNEVKLLAKEMTLKQLFYNQKFGGAKAGVCCQNPLKNNEREKIFKAFGKALKPFLDRKIYIPGTDLGTNQNDIDHLLKGAVIIAENDTADDHDYIDSSYYTAVSVFAVLKSIATFNKINLKDTRIGIQGLGKVGLNLLQLASEHGIKLIAGSTQHGALYSPKGLDVNRIFDLAKKHGDEFINYYNGAQKIELNEFFEQDMDIMCPCAGIYPINKNNIEHIRAKIIVPGCNVAATEEIEKRLYERGIMYLPGFVSNAGGVLGYTLKRFGLERNQRGHFLSQGIQSKVTYLLGQSRKYKRSPLNMVQRIVSQNKEKFTLESNARMNGRLALLIARWQIEGTAGVMRSILSKLIERKLIAPNCLRQVLAKRIIFERLFKDYI